MFWQYLLTALSCALFFGFVVLCVCKYGLLSCYSAYGPAWHKTYPKFNVWSAVTLVTAALLIPVLLENSEGNPWQFAGFLCPAMLLFVALTPDYGTNPLAGKVHSICAGLGALFSIVYILCVYPSLWWLLVVYVALASLGTLICGKYYWCFWFEMAAYAGIYTTMFLVI